ncbi:MAG TPA: cell wall metabolism sensor histidine kinase WalK [Firmicutes bacterium]|nr:cell wall metabolism sensor histidine kinase WalK [Bacillota bacterium]
MPKSFFARLLITYIVVIVVALAVPAIALSRLIQGYFVTSKERELLSKGQEIVDIASDFLEGKENEATTMRILAALDSFVNARVWIIDKTGLIVASSRPGRGRLHGMRLTTGEIQRILAGETVVRRARFLSPWHMGPGPGPRGPMRTLPGEAPLGQSPGVEQQGPAAEQPGPRIEQQVISVGIPIRRDSEVVGALILHSPVTGIIATSNQLMRFICYAGLLALIVALGLGYSISRHVSRPIRQMSRAAARMARGDFNSRVELPRAGEGKNAAEDEISELARSFNHMAEELGRIEENRREFVANVSHELRAPLTAIRGFAQALTDGTVQDDEQRQRYLRLIRDESIRTNRLLEDLLDLSRIEAGKVAMDLRPVNIKEVVESVLEKQALKASRMGISTVDDTPPDLPLVLADGDRIEQVLSNLIDNAIRATPSGGRITVSAGIYPVRQREAAPWLREGAGKNDVTGFVRVSVRDTGHGIPPGDLPHVWDRFYKVDKARSREEGVGTGIGLSIVKRIVEAHGGEVGVSSEAGQGTEFWFTLRIARRDGQDACQPADPH